nr:hypothetical protein CPGR_00193 [Mycolicibacter nonchromogenicus]
MLVPAFTLDRARAVSPVDNRGITRGIPIMANDGAIIAIDMPIWAPIAEAWVALMVAAAVSAVSTFCSACWRCCSATMSCWASITAGSTPGAGRVSASTGATSAGGWMGAAATSACCAAG